MNIVPYSNGPIIGMGITVWKYLTYTINHDVTGQ